MAQVGIRTFISMKCERLEMAVCALGIVVRVTKVYSGLMYLIIQHAKAVDHYLIISQD
jgi:hypothetical protein